MQVHTYSFKFEELNIMREIIEEYMGYPPGQAPEPVPELIEDSLSKAPVLCEIQGGYVLAGDLHRADDRMSITVDDVLFETKRIIVNQLKKADRAILFLCTAGPDIVNKSKKLMSEGDLMTGYVYDVIGSTVVESAMDLIHNDIEKNMALEGLGVTDRYSPGYCGWQVAEQPKLFSFFPEKYCGITLTESSLMDPIKSVSGIIGVGEKAKRKGYVCDLCDIKNCVYRKKHVSKPDDRK